MNSDIYFLQYAIKLAKIAEQNGEVPVGAVVVYQNEIIGEGYNQPISSNDPTAHAEIIALRNAAKNIGNYRLVDTTLYVTLEPCVMCAGAMIHARVQRCIFGAYDPKAGAAQSVYSLLQENKLNHQVICEGGILADECGNLLREFFLRKR